MSFANHIRKIQFPKKGSPLSDLERRGDPEALAASFSNFKAEKEVQAIGAPRASSLYDACMRKHVIGTVLELSEPQWVSLKGKIIYGIGNAVHDWLQNSPALFGDGRFGWWQCKACGQARYFGGPPKRSCEKCGAHQKATVYMEHALRLKKPLMVSGHPDMFFKPSHSKKVRVAEIKTMGGDEFDKLAAPVVGHEWQTHVYMWGCSIDPSLPVEVDSDLGYIVYVTKRTTKDKFPLKIYPILSNPDLLKRIKVKLKIYKDGLVAYPNNLPAPIEECIKSRFEGYRPKQCVALKECLQHV